MATENAQAQNEQERGLSDWGEIQGEAESLQARFDAGEISGDALVAETDALNDRADAADRHFDEAAKLSTLAARTANLAARARQPAWSRPLAEAPSSGGGDDGDTPESDVLAAAIAPDETIRALLNQYLRPPDNGGGRQALSAAGWKLLTQPRKAPGELHTLLSAERGEAFALTPYVDPSGGYVQAEQVWQEVVQIRDRAAAIPSRVRTIPNVPARLTIPTSKVTITFTKGSKKTGQSITPVDIAEVFGRTALTPHRKDAILKIPEEFFEDPAFDAVGEIARAAERSDREALETDILHGSGSGTVNGIVTALKALYAAGGTQVGIDIAGSGSNVVAADVQTFDLELPATSRVNGTWIFGRPGLKKVRLFRTDEGGTGTGEFLFKRALEAGQPDTLNGKEILETEFLEDKITSGVAGDVLWLFGDLDDFWLAVHKDLMLRILEELYAAENMIGYKWTSSRDGSLVRGDAFIYQRRTA